MIKKNQQWLLSVNDTAAILHMQISHRNRDHMRKYFSTWIKGAVGLELWKNGGQKSRETVSRPKCVGQGFSNAQNLKPYYGSLTVTDQIVEESCGLISAIGWSDFLKELNHSTLLCNTLLSFSITFPSCRFFKKVLYHSFYAHLTQKL